jgi:hypothetical protein
MGSRTSQAIGTAPTSTEKYQSVSNFSPQGPTLCRQQGTWMLGGSRNIMGGTENIDGTSYEI